MSNPSPNFYPERNGYRPEIVVLHLTEGHFGPAFDWLRNPISDASATLLVSEEGDPVELVAETDAPWTNGFRRGQAPPTNPYVYSRCWRGEVDPNLITLSIEVEWFQAWSKVRRDTPLYRFLVRQVAEWCQRYNLPVRERVMGHFAIDPEGKPFCGQHIPWDTFYPDVEAEIKRLWELKNSGHDPSPWHETDWAWGITAGLTDGTNPKEPATREQVIAFLHRFERTLKKPQENA